MRAIYKRLILVFIILVVLKIGLSFLIPSPTMFADEYFYSSMARSFYKEGNFMIFGSPSSMNTPLYPIILSLAYIFKNMRIVYIIFKVINALLSSLIIFPAWLLAKEFLSKRKASFVAILCGIWPAGFIFTFFVMAENLFYVLVLFTIYFVYKSFTNDSIKWDFLAGLFLGLTYLTKVLGSALVIGIFISFLIHLIFKRDLSQIKRKLVLYGIALLIVLPWLIRNGMIFGWSILGIVGYVEEFKKVSTISISVALYWLLMYLSYLLLATGIIGGIFNLLSFRSNKNLKIFSIIVGVVMFCFILIATLHTSEYSNTTGWLVGRPLGRYIEAIIPLMLILGFVNLKFKENFYKNKLKYTLLCTFFIIITFKLFSFKLFPVNAISLSYIGLINLGIKYLFGVADKFRILIMTILFALLPFCLLFIKYLNFKRLLYFIGLFFIIVNFISFSMVYYNSNYRWYPLDQMQLGLWFNDNVDSTNTLVLFDIMGDKEESRELTSEDMSYSLKKIERKMIRAAFWMNAYVKIDNINQVENYNYIVSKHNLDYNLIKQVGEFKLYKIR